MMCQWFSAVCGLVQCADVSVCGLVQCGDVSVVQCSVWFSTVC